jgi:hypothetical protein
MNPSLLEVPPLADNERMVAHVDYVAHPGSGRFVLAVTTQALFLRRSKGFSHWRTYFLQRLPIDEVRTVFVKPLAAWGWIALAPLLVSIGIYAGYVIYSPILRGAGGRFSIYPIVLVGIGLLLPFAARRRYGLVITGTRWSFSWKPEFVVGEAARLRQQQAISTIVDGFRAVGIPVVDERTAA